MRGDRKQLPSGGVRLTGELTKSGVFEYQDSAGKVWREYRPPEEVSKADSLATIEDLPVTIGHPPLGVSAKNFGKLAVGHVRAAETSTAGADVLVRGTLVAGRSDAVEGVMSGKLSETSMGYRCRVDSSPGTTPDGKAYDRVQRDITYNHVALLPDGGARLGTRVDGADAPALRLDAEGNQIAPACCADCEGRADDHLPWNDCMAKAMKEYGDEDQAKKVCGSIKAKYGDSMKTTIRKDGKAIEVDAGSVEHISYLEAERDAANARADANEAELAKHREDSAKRERAELVSVAAKALGKEFKADGLTDRQVREKVIAKAMPKVKCDGKDDIYVSGMFDAALFQLAGAAVAPKRGSQSLVNAFALPGRKDAADKDLNSDDEDEEDDEPAYMKKAKAVAKKADSAWDRSDSKGNN